MANWDEIKESVEKNGNVLTLSMEQLREAIGAGRLGVNICADISRTLAGMGLGHIPEALPSYQHEQVRLSKHGTQVGELIKTVLTPSQQNDRTLVDQFGDQAVDYATIVQKIRELVGE